MSRPCSICGRSDKDAIDLALTRGESATRVAALFRVSADAVSRHRHANHGTLASAAARAELRTRADSERVHEFNVLAELRNRLERADKLGNIAEGLVARAAQREDWRTAVAGVSAGTRALGESRACLDLLARLLGEVPNETTTVNVSLHTEWPVLRQNIVLALEPYPEARLRVLESLNGHASG